jgi:Uma2 family endonuclease
LSPGARAVIMVAMAANPAKKSATYEDVLAAPEHLVAEVLDGELHTQPRPAFRHASFASSVLESLGPPFRRGRGGPGGWLILFEPELHLGRDILVPDIAGWRRERMPELPDVAFATLAPDWVCEVFSESTARIDRGVKRRIYAREGVRHLWLADPRAETLEVYRLENGRWVEIETFEGDAVVRAEPFDAIELALGELWAR